MAQQQEQQKQQQLLKELQQQVPVTFCTFKVPSSYRECPTGLVIVDELNGFCAVGGGNLAPKSPNKQISDMVDETDRIAKEFSKRGLPILAFLDTHQPDKPEPPYPPHCIVGTGEEDLVPELKWLETEPNSLLIRKDCINGFVGAFKEDGSNTFVDWIKENQIQALVVLGICTDVCVLDFVVATISAINHGMLHPLTKIYVYGKGCATYDLPQQVADHVGGIPHPQALTHHMGLYFAAARGAKIIDDLVM